MATKHSSTLLRGGTLLVHDEQHNIHAIKADLLIQDGRIAKIEAGIEASPDVQVLNVNGKLLTPGFVDTHHHLWQTTQKGRHGDHSLLDYLPSGMFAGAHHSSDDFFWSELSGALEAIDSGTTTVLDHANHNYSPESVYAGLRAIMLSGLRSFYAYSPITIVDQWKPLSMKPNILPDWVLETWDKLAAAAPFASGRTQLGFGFDGLYLPEEMLKPIFENVYKSAKVMTYHDTRNPMGGSTRPMSFDTLRSKHLIDPSVPTVISHANSLQLSDIPDMGKCNVNASITPSTELGMGMGNPMPIALRLPEFDKHCSLGIDCHSIVSSFMPGQARELLSAVRAHAHAEAWDQGKFYRSLTSAAATPVFPTVLRAFNMMTIGGARAVGLEDSIGQLKVGFRADVVVWDASSPGLVSAVEEDPVAAVVMHSSVRDVEGVLVDGLVRKWDGKLVDVRLDAEAVPAPLDSYSLPVDAGTTSLAWKDIVRKLLASKAATMKKYDELQVDMRSAQLQTLDAWHLDKTCMID